jgi:hypothetical protein
VKASKSKWQAVNDLCSTSEPINAAANNPRKCQVKGSSPIDFRIPTAFRTLTTLTTLYPATYCNGKKMQYIYCDRLNFDDGHHAKYVVLPFAS